MRVATRNNLRGGVRVVHLHVQGYLVHKKTPKPVGPPQDPRHRPAVGLYRSTSLIRNSSPLGPFSRTVPRALWWSLGGALCMMSEVPLYCPRSWSSQTCAPLLSIVHMPTRWVLLRHHPRSDAGQLQKSMCRISAVIHAKCRGSRT